MPATDLHLALRATDDQPTPTRRDLQRVYRNQQASIVSEWTTVTAVRAALLEHEGGNFNSSAKLVDAFGRDDRISGVLGTRVQALMGTDVEFESAQPKPGMTDAEKKAFEERATVVAEDVESWWFRCFPEAELSQLLHWGITLGFGIGEIIWTRTKDRWTPRLKVWNPQFVYWEWSRRAFVLNTENEQIAVRPGDGKWILFTPFGLEYGWMKGLVRSLSVWFMTRMWTVRDWNRFDEILGQPVIVGTVPTGADGDTKIEFLNDLASMFSDGVVTVPQDPETGKGYAIELLQAAKDSPEAFEKLLQYADKCITIAVLGQNLTTEVQGGSRAASETHADVKRDILKADAEALSTAVHNQVYLLDAQFNYGDLELAPWLKYQTEPPKDLKTDAETLKTLGEAVAALQEAGVPVDVDALAEQYNVPVLTVEQVKKRDAEKAEKETENPDPATEPDDDPEPLSARTVTLASGQTIPRGLRDADDYLRVSGDESIHEGTAALAPDLEALMLAVEQAESFEETRTAITALLMNMSPSDLQTVLTDNDTLANLVGQVSMRRDTGRDRS